MSGSKSNRALLGSGLLLALSSSLCCVVPILAIVSGSGSMAASIGWATPLRPYLLITTVVVLGFAFYRVYRPRPKDECGCVAQKSWLQSKTFLWIIASVSLVLTAFPYYAKFLQPQPGLQKVVVNDSAGIRRAVLDIEGMSCAACENHVNYALQKKDGVVMCETSYAKGTTTIEFDTTKVSLSQLVSAIEQETGYKVKQ